MIVPLASVIAVKFPKKIVPAGKLNVLIAVPERVESVSVVNTDAARTWMQYHVPVRAVVSLKNTLPLAAERISVNKFPVVALARSCAESPAVEELVPAVANVAWNGTDGLSCLDIVF